MPEAEKEKYTSENDSLILEDDTMRVNLIGKVREAIFFVIGERACPASIPSASPTPFFHQGSLPGFPSLYFGCFF